MTAERGAQIGAFPEAQGVGVYQWPLYNTLVAQTENCAVVEELYDPTHSIVVRQRLVPVEPPFSALLIERDDGTQCPATPKEYTADPIFVFRFNPFSVRAERFGWEDFLVMLGGNNDQIASFHFSSVAELESLNNSFYQGSDADAWLTSASFVFDSIPAPQDPWSGQ